MISEAILSPEELIRERFAENDIEIESVEVRDYPEEQIFVVRVHENDIDKASQISNLLDHDLGDHGINGFVTVRRAKQDTVLISQRIELGVQDPRATDLTNLITARSRVSEIQPSLAYIPDAANNISTVTAPRHHLIFGRRGAGKTALMVEAKKMVELNGHLSIWINLQTLRHETANRAFLWVSKKICDLVQTNYRDADLAPTVLVTASLLSQKIDALLAEDQVSDQIAHRFVPQLQALIQRFLRTTDRRLYIFIDELHYLLPKAEQARLLDMIHGAVRDCDAWLKIAGIKHLSRWFQSNPPVGLQTGHDAGHIDLDLTLENPSGAKHFLEEVLRSYAKNVGITSLFGVLSPQALDRLVLASGAVPRDYLVLSAAAIRQAQKRERARLVGVQDVNKAAGEAADVKIAELEEDAASEGSTNTILAALQRLRTFCLDEKKWTYFRIDFRDKEDCAPEYNLIQSLLDLRLTHLVSASLSDEHRAGRRFEVFMLDLSQFSGQRLKKHLKVLDFEAGHIVLKETGTNVATKIGNTPKKRLGLLRRGPLLELNELADEVENPDV
jgi:hypothetical protein